MAYTTGFRGNAVDSSAYSIDYSADGAIQYGNPVDGNNGDAYIPIIFSRKMLKDFYSMTVFSEISNTDYEGEIKSGGDKVYIRRVPTLSIEDYVLGGPDGGITYEVPTEDANVLNIDQAKYWAFQVDHIDAGQTDLGLVNEFSANAAEQLKIKVDADVLDYICDPALCNAYNVNTGVFAAGTTGAGADRTYDMGYDAANGERLVDATENSDDNILNVIVEMNAVLDENNIPETGRWVVLPPSITQLLKKGDLKRADVTGDGTGVVRTGLIGQIDGMKIYKSTQLPKGATETNAFLCPFGTNAAITFAGQITKSESGTLEKSFGKYWRGLFVYGRAVVQPQALGLAVLAVVATP